MPFHFKSVLYEFNTKYLLLIKFIHLTEHWNYILTWKVNTNNKAVSRLRNEVCGCSYQRGITKGQEILHKLLAIPFKFAVYEKTWPKNTDKFRTRAVHEGPEGE